MDPHFLFPNMSDALKKQLHNYELSDEQLASIAAAETLYDKVLATLKTVHDPEISVNIWDLGLVYRLDVKETSVHIEMTLTAPTCPVADAIPEEVRIRLQKHVPELTEINVELVWEPQWDKSMMSEEAKLILDMW